MLNSAALLMRQSQLIKNSPRAFILLQLHLQKHHVAETFCQVPAVPRSFPVNGQLFPWGQCRGIPSRPGAPRLAQPCLPWTPRWGAPGKQGGRWEAVLLLLLLIYPVQKDNTFAFRQCHIRKSPYGWVSGCPKMGWKESMPTIGKSKWMPSPLAPLPLHFRVFLAHSCMTTDSLWSYSTIS